MSRTPVLAILAAGASERLGQPKALVLLGGRAVLERLLDAGAGFARPVVVAGADAMAIARLAGARAEVLHHAGWRLGRTGSLAAAAAARTGRDLLVAPVDVPLVPREVFEALARAWDEAGAPARGWLAPAVELPAGRRHGHPVLVGRELAAELAGLPPDLPLRDLRGRAGPLLEVMVEDPAVLDDLDTPLDLARLEQRLAAAGTA